MAVAGARRSAGSVPVLLAVLFGLGVQATMFGPLKYGILPDHLREDELVAGNGLIEASTFLAILVGTVAGGALVLLDGRAGHRRRLPVSVCRCVGLAAAFGVPRSPGRGPFAAHRLEHRARNDRGRRARPRPTGPVWLSILGLSWFWAIGATLLSEFPSVARDALGADGQVVTLLLTMFAIGVGVGLDAVRAAAARRGQRPARAVRGASASRCSPGISATAVIGAGGLHLVDVAAVLRAPRVGACWWICCCWRCAAASIRCRCTPSCRSSRSRPTARA